MEETVVLKRSTYDDMVANSKKIEAQASIVMKDNEKLLSQCQAQKELILDLSKDEYEIKNQSLSDCLDINTYTYGIKEPKKLLDAGFTSKEMDFFISKEWSKVHPEETESKGEQK